VDTTTVKLGLKGLFAGGIGSGGGVVVGVFAGGIGGGGGVVVGVFMGVVGVILEVVELMGGITVDVRMSMGVDFFIAGGIGRNVVGDSSSSGAVMSPPSCIRKISLGEIS
jgi:hypothetical protein